ncbi:MAG: PAS domain S-box protein [Bacteroidota bacterium]
MKSLNSFKIGFGNLLVVFLSLVVFLIDLLTPLGYSVWLIYLIIVLVAFKSFDSGFQFFIASLCTTLIMAGYFYSPSGIDPTVGLFNRIAGIFVLWMGFYILITRQFNIKRLYDNEEYNRILFKISPVGLALCKMDGSLVDVNPAYSKIIGYSVDDTLKLTYWDITPRKYEIEESMQLEKLKNTGRYGPYEKEYVHKDGHFVPVLLNGIIYNMKGENYIWSSVEDLTERKAAVEKEMKSAYQISSILENISDAFVSLDKNWCYTYMNKKAGEIFNRNPAEMIGKHIWTEFPEGIGEPFYNNYYKAFNEQVFIKMEEYYPPYDKWFQNRIYPSSQGLSIFFYDITEGKKNEAKLEQNRLFIESILNASPDLIYIYDIEAAKNVYANKTIQSVLGYSEEEISGMQSQLISNLMHPDDFAYYIKNTIPKYYEADDLQIIESSYRMKRKDGEWRLLQSKESIFKRKEDGVPQQIFGMVEDITERKRMELLLESEKQILEMIAKRKSMPEILESIVLNIEKLSPEITGSILLLDEDGIHVRYGAAPNLPKEFNDAIEGLDIGPTAGSCGTAMFTKKQVIVKDIENDPLWKDYKNLALKFDLRACWSNPIIGKNGRVLGSFALYSKTPAVPSQLDLEMIDRTSHLAEIAIQRVKEEDEVIREGKKRKLLLDSAQDGIFVLNQDFKVVETNPSFAKMIGYTIEETLQLYSWDWDVIYSTKEKLQETWPEIPDEKQYFETRIKNKEGKIFDVFISGSPAYSEVSGERLMLYICTDITERKKNENELKLYRENLEQLVKQRTAELEIAKDRAESADKLKSAFLATMSHELRTPLNSIIGFSGILMQEHPGKLNPEQKKQLGMVQNSSRHLLSLINEILDLSKIEAGQLKLNLEPVELPKVIYKVIDSSKQFALMKNLEIGVFIEPGIHIIISDKLRIEQILLNLVNNAIKFTEKGFVKVDCLQGDNSLVIRVQDSGIGIKEDELELLFKPFSQVDIGTTRKHDGTGLGLSICKKLVELLNGRITVESEFGVGSTFTVSLPVK